MGTTARNELTPAGLAEANCSRRTPSRASEDNPTVNREVTNERPKVHGRYRLRLTRWVKCGKFAHESNLARTISGTFWLSIVR